jgi:hypothetical protein
MSLRSSVTLVEWHKLQTSHQRIWHLLDPISNAFSLRLQSLANTACATYVDQIDVGLNPHTISMRPFKNESENNIYPNSLVPPHYTQFDPVKRRRPVEPDHICMSIGAAILFITDLVLVTSLRTPAARGLVLSSCCIHHTSYLVEHVC